MENNELAHYGILGMKWGVRRYQNRDGSLTSEGKKRYNYAQTQATYNYRQAAEAYKVSGNTRHSNRARARVFENAERLMRIGESYAKEFEALYKDEKISSLRNKANSARQKVAQDFVKTNPIMHYVFSANEFRVKKNNKVESGTEKKKTSDKSNIVGSEAEKEKISRQMYNRTLEGKQEAVEQKIRSRY